MRPSNVATCTLSLTKPGICCAGGSCTQDAEVAALVEYGDGFCEHAWCLDHAAEAHDRVMPFAHEDGVLVATKPYNLSPTWEGAL